MFDINNRDTWVTASVVGKRIHRIRVHARLSREQICEQLYISVTTYHTWRSGKRYPNFEAIRSIADIGNVTIEDMLAKESKLDNEDYAVGNYGYNNWYKIDVAKRLRYLFGGDDFSQARLARLLSVSPQTVYNWVSGRNIPSDAVTKRMAKYLNVPVEEITKGDME